MRKPVSRRFVFPVGAFAKHYQTLFAQLIRPLSTTVLEREWFGLCVACHSYQFASVTSKQHDEEEKGACAPASRLTGSHRFLFNQLTAPPAGDVMTSAGDTGKAQRGAWDCFFFYFRVCLRYVALLHRASLIVTAFWTRCVWLHEMFKKYWRWFRGPFKPLPTTATTILMWLMWQKKAQDYYCLLCPETSWNHVHAVPGSSSTAYSGTKQHSESIAIALCSQVFHLHDKNSTNQKMLAKTIPGWLLRHMYIQERNHL